MTWGVHLTSDLGNISFKSLVSSYIFFQEWVSLSTLCFTLNLSHICVPEHIPGNS